MGDEDWFARWGDNVVRWEALYVLDVGDGDWFARLGWGENVVR